MLRKKKKGGRPFRERTPSSFPYQHAPRAQKPLVVRLVLLLAVSSVEGVGIGSTVLALETDGLVNDKVAGDGVEGSADGETNDDTYLSFKQIPPLISTRSRIRRFQQYNSLGASLPRGHNSAGMLFARMRRRWETVWAVKRG